MLRPLFYFVPSCWVICKTFYGEFAIEMVKKSVLTGANQLKMLRPLFLFLPSCRVLWKTFYIEIMIKMMEEYKDTATNNLKR